MNDLWCFSFEMNNWHPVKSFGTQPGPRQFHAAVVYGKFYKGIKRMHNKRIKTNINK
jgi:hypothetical protein